MRRNGAGGIINIDSGTINRRAPLFAHYVASKGAVLPLTRSMARELADNAIRVNFILVGHTLSYGVMDHPQLMDQVGEFVVSSRMIKRDMQSEDLAGTVRFLASDANGFITGQAVNVDGGQYTY